MACAPVLYSPPPFLPAHEPRRATSTLLHTTLQAELDGFFDDLDRQGRSLPWFVRRELFDFLECGDPAFGFVRVRCGDCKLDRAVPFSCKRRGFCPSCAGRRMADLAAHWRDNVLPDVPIRQWVLTLPSALRYRLAFNQALLTKVLTIFIRTVFAWQRLQVRRMGMVVADMAPGSITAIQRFGSALNLNIHFHSLFFEGLFVETLSGDIRFVTVTPTDDDITMLLGRVRDRVLRLLQHEDAADLLAADEPGLAACAAASVKGRVAVGARAGQRVERIGSVGPVPWATLTAPLSASLEGFTLHANTFIPKGRGDQLERLCRYVSRPAFSHDRLRSFGDGTFTYRLKSPWRDGTTHIRLTATELIEKLAALVPYPRKKLIRYHGVLAPNARLRSRVVPKAPNSAANLTADQPRARLPWSELLRRVFLIDALCCPRCGADCKIISVMTDPKVIGPFLACIGLNNPGAGPRAPP